MKSRYVMLGIIFGMFLTISSCKKDEIPVDEEIEGDVRDRFEGNWTVVEKSKLLGERNFTVNIIKDDQFPSQVNISNFYLVGSNDTITATVSSVLVNTITIQDQTVNSSHYSGVGEMVNEQTINFNYYVDDGNANPDTISASFIR